MSSSTVAACSFHPEVSQWCSQYFLELVETLGPSNEPEKPYDATYRKRETIFECIYVYVRERERKGERDLLTLCTFERARGWLLSATALCLLEFGLTFRLLLLLLLSFRKDDEYWACNAALDLSCSSSCLTLAVLLFRRYIINHKFFPILWWY